VFKNEERLITAHPRQCPSVNKTEGFLMVKKLFDIFVDHNPLYLDNLLILNEKKTWYAY